MSEPSYASVAIKDMEQGKSVLLTFGEPGRLLKKKIALTGFLCRLICFIMFNPIFLLLTYIDARMWRFCKRNAIRVVRFFFPFHIKGHTVSPTPFGQIVVINHPTLNDPICGILYALHLYPDREVIVPVNLPWFESVCRYRAKLLKIDINIVPILTPETAKRLGASDHVSKVQNALMHNYTAEFSNTLSRGGLAVVAQQATRQHFLFKSPAQGVSGEGVLSTISLVLVGIKRAKLLEQACFIPVGVIPPSFATKPTINPFQRYTLNIGEPILAADLAAVKNEAKRPADLYMLQRLRELLPKEYHYAEGE